MGYGEAQMRDLEATIEKADVDLVIVATPIDLTRVISIRKPFQRVRYELQEIGKPTLEEILKVKFGKTYVGFNPSVGQTCPMENSGIKNRPDAGRFFY